MKSFFNVRSFKRYSICISAAFVLLLCFSNYSYAQITGDYKSNGTGGGNWNVTTSWLTYNGSSYVAAAAAPSTAGNNIIIQGGDAVTITSAETLGANITVSGTLTLSGTLVCGIYNVLGAGGFVLNGGAMLSIGSTTGISLSGATGNIQTTTRTFNTAANYVYTSSAAQVTGNGLPAGLTATVTDNNTNTVSGLTLSQSLTVTNPGSFVVSTGGVLNCPNLVYITGSGNFTLNSGASFFIGSIAGISTTASTGSIQITGVKTFNAAANYTYYGTLAQVTGNALPATLTGIINFTNTSGSGSLLTNSTVVNSPGIVTVIGALACATSIVISGTGTFTLNAGGFLLTANAAGISATGASGSIQTSVINYNTNGNYIYYGSVAQVTGTGLPATLVSLNINNSSVGGVSLTNNTTMNGVLTLTNGIFCLNGNTFTIPSGRTIGRQSGSLSLCGGNLVFLGTVSVSYSGVAAVTTGLEIPPSPSGLIDLTINGAGKIVTQGSDITINSTLTMTAGTLIAGGFALNYSAGSRLIYNGAAAQTVGIEWPGAAFDKNITISNTFAASGVILNANKTNYTGILTINSGGFFNSGAFNTGGTGNLAINAGGTFITPNVNGVSPAGAFQLTGTRTFATGSSYTFNGTATQVTGIEMPVSVANLTINNTSGANPAVTLTNAGSGTLTVTGILGLTAGIFDAATNNMNLIFQTGNTPITSTGGTLSMNTAASLLFGTAGNTAGAAFTLPNNVFITSPVLNNLGINRINSLTLGNQNITLAGTLTLTAGVLDLAGTTLTFQNGNTPVSITAGSLTAGAASSLQFGSAGNTGGNAFTLPNNLFTTIPTFTNLTINRANALTLGTQNITLTGALTLTSGAFNIGPSTLGLNGTISVSGGLLNGGSSSAISVGGSSIALTLPAIGNNLNNLVVARPNISGVPAVNLSADLIIAGTLNLSGGSVSLGTNSLTMSTGATITSYNSSRFVATNNNAASGGYLVQLVTTATPVFFPIGTSTYTPVTVDDAAGTADNFKVRVFDGVLSAGTTGAAISNINSFVNKTWLVEEMVAGGSNATVTLQWNGTDENVSFARANSFITHYDGVAWDAIAPSAAATISGSIYSQTRTGLTSFSPFAVESSSSILPIKLISFSAGRKDKTILLNWATSAEINNASFGIQRSINGLDFETIGSVPGHGTSYTRSAYSFADLQPVNERTSYYRLKEIDIDGHFEYSNICIIGPDNASVISFMLYPVPVANQLTIAFDNRLNTDRILTISNMSGQVIRKQFIAGTAGKQIITLPVSDLPKGTYFVKLTAGKTTIAGTFIK